MLKTTFFRNLSCEKSGHIWIQTCTSQQLADSHDFSPPDLWHNRQRGSQPIITLKPCSFVEQKPRGEGIDEKRLKIRQATSTKEKLRLIKRHAYSAVHRRSERPLTLLRPRSYAAALSPTLLPFFVI